MITSLTRVVRFRAEHHLALREWSTDRNRQVFGQLTESHPHDYACAITVAGVVDRRTGMLVDLSLLDQILSDEVLAPLDRKNLNRDVPFFAAGHPLPTCEALAAWLFTRVAARLPSNVALQRVRVEEDPTLYAECTRPD
jgi:6-pyruvoyltetrahydropterin/6-carboxytetrahydropterin synthase